MNARWRGIIASFALQTTHLLMEPSMWLAFLDRRVYSWLTFSLRSTLILRSIFCKDASYSANTELRGVSRSCSLPVAGCPALLPRGFASQSYEGLRGDQPPRCFLHESSCYFWRQVWQVPFSRHQKTSLVTKTFQKWRSFSMMLTGCLNFASFPTTIKPEAL